MALFSYIFLQHKKYYLSIISALVVVLAGARSGFLLMILALLFNFKEYFSFKKVLNFIVGAFFVIIIDRLFDNFLFNQAAFYVDSFSSISFSNDLTSEETVDFTAYRSVLWVNAFNELSQDWFSASTIFGRGSLSSLEFNYQKLGVRIWMHNDFFDVIFSYGYLGICMYLCTAFNFFLKQKSYFGLFFFLIAAFSNGFLTYTPFQLIFLIYLANEYPLINTNKKSKKNNYV
jgi:hypothetical protein